MAISLIMVSRKRDRKAHSARCKRPTNCILCKRFEIQFYTRFLYSSLGGRLMQIVKESFKSSPTWETMQEHTAQTAGFSHKQPKATGLDTRPQTRSTTIVSSLSAFYIQYTYKHTHTDQPAGAGRGRPLRKPQGGASNSQGIFAYSFVPSLPSLSICMSLLVQRETVDPGSSEAPLRSHTLLEAAAISSPPRRADGLAPVLAGAEREPRGSGVATTAAAAAVVVVGLSR